jgi:hypothetical protein
MQGGGGPIDARPERRFRRVRLLPLVAVLLVGVGATVLVWRRADDDVTRRDTAAARHETGRKA